MKNIKACLPDIIQTRVDDLTDAQVLDEEIQTHMRELSSRIVDLEALVGEADKERALQFADDIKLLCARIRRGFVDMAYRQGLADGMAVAGVVISGETSNAE